MLVGVDLISRRHALLKWCSHEEIYLLTVMPPSMLCFQGNRVWLATIVTNTDLHPFRAWPPTYFPPLSAVCCGGWVGSGGVCKPLCMHVGYMHRSRGGVLRGFQCKSSRVQNTLMDPNKTPFQTDCQTITSEGGGALGGPFLQHKNGPQTFHSQTSCWHAHSINI